MRDGRCLPRHPKVKTSPNTLRAYTGVFDRVAALLTRTGRWPTSPTTRPARCSNSVGRGCAVDLERRASAVLALNVEDLDLPNKQARIVAKGGTTMWITRGTDTAHLLPRLIAGRTQGPLFLSAPAGPTPDGHPPTLMTCARKPDAHDWATTAPASCSAGTLTDSNSTSSGTARPPTSTR